MMYQLKNISLIRSVKSILTPRFFNPVINMPPIKVVGVLKETKDYENRVGLTPIGLRQLALENPQVTFVVQRGAGLLSGFSDQDYLEAAPKGRVMIVDSTEEVVAFSDLLLKFKEPTALEVRLISEASTPKVIFCYGHYAGNKLLALEALASKGMYFTFETARKAGRNILLEPMSEIAGQIAIDQAQEFFDVKDLSGKKVAVFGGLGVAGLASVEKALRQNAQEVIVFELPSVIERSKEKLKTGLLLNDPRVKFYDATHVDFEILKQAEVMVMAAYKPGQRPPILIDLAMTQMLEALGRRIIIIDIAIDQGGSTYFTRNAKAAQKHGQPPEAYFKYVHHSFIANMPSLEKQKASLAQEKVNLPYFSKLIAVGKDFVNDEVLASALNFVGGYNVVEVLKKDIGLKYIPLGKIKFE